MTRVITDHLGVMNGRFTGLASLSGQGDHLRYDEVGQLVLQNGPVMQANRTYHWAFVAGLVQVSFADGSDFHSFAPDGQVAGTTHLCGADTYNVTYDFRDWPRWQTIWHVQGPRKDYRSVSHYSWGVLAQTSCKCSTPAQ